MKLSPDGIKSLGFEWPKYPAVVKAAEVIDGRIDLSQVLKSLKSSRDLHQRQVNAAYRFKSQTGADYSDFTDRFDEHVRTVRELKMAINFVEEILAAAGGSYSPS